MINKAAAAIVTASILSATLAIIINFPSTTPYSVFNTGDDGISIFYSEIRPRIISNITELRGLNNANLTVFLPMLREISPKELETIKGLVENGTHLVIIDEEGYSNRLLLYLGVGWISNYTVLDEVWKKGTRDHPVIKVKCANNESLKVITYRPSYIMKPESVTHECIGYTSDYAYADEDNNGMYTVGESVRKYVIVVSVNYGKGALTAISDMDVLTNELITQLDNLKLVKALVNDREPVLVTEYFNYGTLDKIKLCIASFELRERGSLYMDLFSLVEVCALLAITGVMYHATGKQ